MGYQTTIRLASLDAIPRIDVHRVLSSFLYALAQANAVYLRRYPETPPLYRSGVVYHDDNGTTGDADTWVDIPEVLGRGYGHCADLAAWRAAEHWRAGFRQARPIITEWQHPELDLYHAIVQLGPSQTEDPSVMLGMRY